MYPFQGNPQGVIFLSVLADMTQLAPYRESPFILAVLFSHPLGPISLISVLLVLFLEVILSVLDVEHLRL